MCRSFALRGLRFFAVLVLLSAAVAHAAEHRFSLLLDTDDDPTSGCNITSSAGATWGIEQVVTAVVVTTPTAATVARIERQICEGGVLGPVTVLPGGGYPVGLDNGIDGVAVIEVALARNLLPVGSRTRVTVLGVNARGEADLSPSFLLSDAQVGPIAVPVPLWLLVLLAPMLLATGWKKLPRQAPMVLIMGLAIAQTLAWAATVILDGQTDDWGGVAPVVNSPHAGPVNADIVAVFYQSTGSELYFRIDADVRPAGPGETSIQVSAGADQAIVLPSAASLSGSATRVPPATFTYAWLQTAGPALVSLDDASSAHTTATFTQPGAYVFQLTASAEGESASATTTVTVTDRGPSLANIADRTVVLGQTLSLALVGSSPNVAETLTYSLDSKPVGAALGPAQLLHWTPTAAQVGVHSFIARVTDGKSRSDSKSFSVTVVAQNRAPQLVDQPDAVIKRGATFQRNLMAIDPDGDPVVFALISGPTGATLSGPSMLSWSSGSAAPGRYGMTVKATDPAGLSDLKRFTVEVSNVPGPLARDDSYDVRFGASLTVNAAAGVLLNDFSPDGSALAAIKLTGPDKGALSAFGADGSFSYTAPSSIPDYPSLMPKTLWGALIPDNNGFSLAADINRDGGADLIANTFGMPIAFNGKTGQKLWQGWDVSASSVAKDCRMYLFGTTFALGVVDGTDDIALIMGTECDGGGTAGSSTRLIAVDTDPAHAVGGATRVMWVSERLDEMLPVPPGIGATPVPTHVPGWGLASFVTPTLARLTPSGSVKVLTRFLIQKDTYGYDSDGDGSVDRFAGCRVATGKPEDEGRGCKVTFIVDAASGVKEVVLTAPNGLDESGPVNGLPMRQTAPVVADLDGDGQVEIISGGDVFKRVNGQWVLAWQAAYPSAQKFYEPTSVSVADLDGDGRAEVILQVEFDKDSARYRGFAIYAHDGTLRRVFTYPSSDAGMPTIADVDGDGAPEIVFVARGVVYAYRPDGALLWANVIPDDDGTHPGDFPCYSASNPSGTKCWPQPVDQRSGAGASVQVYDLDLDGAPEVIVNGTHRIAIYDGRTGAVKSSAHNNALSWTLGVPMVVDADGDGHAEVFSSAGNPGLCGGCPATNIAPFAGQNRDWAPAPLIFNQLSYNPWAINDAGKIGYDGGVHRSFRKQRQMGAATDRRVRSTATFTYKANDGAADSNAASVRVRIAPQNSPPIITSVPPTGVAVTPAQTSRIYTINAYDPDPGDAVHYELVHSDINTYYFPQVAVDSNTGAVTVATSVTQKVFIIVAAVDNQGARTEQAFLVDISGQVSPVPNVMGQSLAAAKASIESATLQWRVAGEVFAPQPAGTVVSQAPMASAGNVPRGATVSLTLSKGPQPVAVPLLMGQAYAAASTQLNALGLTANATYAYSKTVPSGQVMAQTPAPGVMVTPLPANPVGVTVSAGVGLVLRLNHSVVSAGQPITVTPMAFSEGGDPLPVPPLSYAVTPVQTPHLGAVPVATGNTINTQAGTLGAFRVTATDAVNARSATVDFAVLLPPGTGSATNGDAYASMFTALDSMQALRQDLKAARAANDSVAMVNLLGQMVTIWRGVDLGRVRTAMPLVTPQQFPPTVAMMQGWGHSATADDLLMQQSMRQAIDSLRSFTQALRSTGSTYAQLNVLADTFAVDAGRTSGLTISRYGGILNQREYTILLSHEIPVFFDTLMEVVAASIGMPPRSSPFAAKALLARQRGSQASFMLKSAPSLAELAVTQAVDMITEKIMEQGSEVYKNAKQFAVDAMKQSAWTAAAVTIASELKSIVYGQDLYEVVSGSSLSFRVFDGGLSFIEAPGGLDEPGLVSVLIIGPDTISSAGSAITDLFNKLKEGFSYGLDPATNPLRFKNLDDAKQKVDGLMARLKDVGAAVTTLQDEIDNAYQRPTSVDRGCVFTPDPNCSQLIYADGFKPVYSYTPPPGFGNLGGIPVPIVFIVQNQLTGDMSFGTPYFMPNPASPP